MYSKLCSLFILCYSVDGCNLAYLRPKMTYLFSAQNVLLLVLLVWCPVASFSMSTSNIGSTSFRTKYLSQYTTTLINKLKLLPKFPVLNWITLSVLWIFCRPSMLFTFMLQGIYHLVEQKPWKFGYCTLNGSSLQTWNNFFCFLISCYLIENYYYLG